MGLSERGKEKDGKKQERQESETRKNQVSNWTDSVVTIVSDKAAVFSPPKTLMVDLPLIKTILNIIHF